MSGKRKRSGAPAEAPLVTTVASELASTELAPAYPPPEGAAGAEAGGALGGAHESLPSEDRLPVATAVEQHGVVGYGAGQGGEGQGVPSPSGQQAFCSFAAAAFASSGAEGSAAGAAYDPSAASAPAPAPDAQTEPAALAPAATVMD